MCLQEIELSTGDFKASSAFAEGLLACAAHAGNWLQSIRVVQALPSRQCNPKVVYGEKSTRLEMYRGAQVCFKFHVLSLKKEDFTFAAGFNGKK